MAEVVVEAFDLPVAVLPEHLGLRVKELETVAEDGSGGAVLPGLVNRQLTALQHRLSQGGLVAERAPLDRPPIYDLRKYHHQGPGLVEPLGRD